jgi:hypothetical protein
MIEYFDFIFSGNSAGEIVLKVFILLLFFRFLSRSIKKYI